MAPVSTLGQTPAPCYLLPEGCVDAGILTLVGNQRLCLIALAHTSYGVIPKFSNPPASSAPKQWLEEEREGLARHQNKDYCLDSPLPIPSTWSSPGGGQHQREIGFQGVQETAGQEQ